MSMLRQVTISLEKLKKDSSFYKDFILIWNLAFPVDRWWRKKHGIPFGAETHLESSFQSMEFEYIEDCMYNEVNNSDKYIKDSGSIFKSDIVDEEDEYDKIFDDIDIS